MIQTQYLGETVRRFGYRFVNTSTAGYSSQTALYVHLRNDATILYDCKTDAWWIQSFPHNERVASGVGLNQLEIWLRESLKVDAEENLRARLAGAR